jgi:hypothetical protein
MANTDALLIGSNERPAINFRELQNRMEIPEIKRRLSRIGIDTAYDFLSFFYLDTRAVETFVQGVKELNTDSNPIIEFSAPKYLLELQNPDTLFAILKNSHRAKLPLRGTDNISLVQRKRIYERAKYFRDWRFPEYVINSMIRDTLQ